MRTISSTLYLLLGKARCISLHYIEMQLHASASLHNGDCFAVAVHASVYAQQYTGPDLNATPSATNTCSQPSVLDPMEAIYQAALALPSPRRTAPVGPYLASTSSWTFSIDLKYLTVLTRSSLVASSLGRCQLAGTGRC